MDTPCFNHSTAPATTACNQCGIPLCAECTTTVADKSVCSRCVDAIRTRVASQIDPAPAAPLPRYAAQPEGLTPVRLLTGIALGTLIGVIGAFIWEKVVFYSHFNIGYLAALIGFGVGYGILLGTKRGGMVPAILGGVIALAAQVFGYYLLDNDELAKAMIEHSMAPVLMPIGMFLTGLPRDVGVIGWVIVAIGVYGGFKTPYRAGS